MKRGLYVTGVVLAILLVASCTTFKLSGIQITREIPSYTTVGEFDITVSVMEFLGSSGGTNMFNASATAMDEKIYDAIQREIQKYTADAAVAVTVEYQASMMNSMLNSMTMFILAPATARITGVIVKYN